ncbi:unnamed protein product [Taenia asiatica]|uniref:A20-type domain-containing protein n=1 Tax=Taenia asiatica TaxID=60517 RepID=A0A0R3VWE0_TAEAS|nr:unnamed protein product [Taenia asiatica]
MEENDQTQAGPRLCRKGCGFYGSPNFDGFCSKCHRDMQEANKHGKSAPGDFSEGILKSGFTCRCGGLYCTVHRYSDSHDCSFDYRESGQADIRKANPQVICSKINKI